MAESMPAPTAAELGILKVLWSHGPGTVREIHDVLGQRSGVGYTTVLKLLQIMLEKGLVARDERARAHVYSATQGEAATEQRLLRDLRDRAFGGSTARLVMRALADAPASEQELNEVRALLARFANDEQEN